MYALLIPAGIIGAASVVGIKLLSSSAEDVGNAIDSTGSGALKIALAVGGTYAALKYTKVI